MQGQREGLALAKGLRVSVGVKHLGFKVKGGV